MMLCCSKFPLNLLGILKNDLIILLMKYNFFILLQLCACLEIKHLIRHQGFSITMRRVRVKPAQHIQQEEDHEMILSEVSSQEMMNAKEGVF